VDGALCLALSLGQADRFAFTSGLWVGNDLALIAVKPLKAYTVGRERVALRGPDHFKARPVQLPGSLQLRNGSAHSRRGPVNRGLGLFVFAVFPHHLLGVCLWHQLKSFSWTFDVLHHRAQIAQGGGHY